jgi:hypothetical protein
MRRLYRLLLKLYPARFREEYVAAMERDVLDDYGEAHGRCARAAFWLRALADLAVSLPREIAREARQDLRYAMRVYRQRPLATLLAVAALALAIGVTTGIFSVVNALLIRSLPFRDAERLVEVFGPKTGRDRNAFRAWRDRGGYLEQASAWSVNEMNLGLAHEAARVRVAETTADFLSLLGAEPVIGRGFAPEEDIAGQDGVAVLSYGLWQQSFGGDPRALGSTVRLNGVPATVIGVAPPGLDYPGQAAVWTPTIFDLERLPKSGALFSQITARLKPGVTVRRASAMYEAESAGASAGAAKLPASTGCHIWPRCATGWRARCVRHPWC